MPGADEFIPTRESLLSRLKEWDDHESWREFFDIYGKLIYGLALKSGLTESEGQDVVQETMVSVVKQMPGFTYDPALGSFKGWLLQITRRRIADQFRKRRQPPALAKPSRRPNLQSEDGAETATVEKIPDQAEAALESAWEAEWQQNLLEQALARVKRRVSPKQFQMFDLYVTQNWPMTEVTNTLGVNPAQVYMAKMRVTRLLKKELLGLEVKSI
jgi:RNA polymerase sigma-70 factor (ECF subfamily)